MPTTAEDLRRTGIAVARTMEGYDLPVIDVTHPCFALSEDPESVQALYDALLRDEERNRRVPKFLLRMMVKSAAKRSRLFRAMFGSGTSYLDGLSTYAMKLGPDNLLPPYDTPMDRRFAATPHVTFMRLRMQQMAHLLADWLASKLTASDRRELHLINIAGGPGMDSINGLILLACKTPELLRRPITIHVLDLDGAGPFFGERAVSQLKAKGGRLHGLDVTLTHRPYDWKETSTLETLVEELVWQGSVIAAMSEGGLFEYGSDEAIIANLKALRADGRGARCVIGSVTRTQQERARLTGASQFKIIPRGLEVFAPLAAQAGFRVGEIRQTAWSDQVELRAI
ncbi:hypothetical protein [Microvirga puerhi]|uniref:Uncharacterized protein n=1 Tax=Microvirga puerhi TaxID=2876078 RepID=A0ABS7VPR4_9HYPH|nr:hypothetical protein [Microvirga puerhi]MBZ6077055.1 hypothetical protein [Microvirga puerhi]